MCETEELPAVRQGVHGGSNKRSTIEDLERAARVTALEDVLRARVVDALALLLEFSRLDPNSAGYGDAERHAQFLRGVVAGLRYAIRRVREDEAARA